MDGTIPDRHPAERPIPAPGPGGCDVRAGAVKRKSPVRASPLSPGLISFCTDRGSNLDQCAWSPGGPLMPVHVMVRAEAGVYKAPPFAQLPHDIAADSRLTPVDVRVITALLFWA